MIVTVASFEAGVGKTTTSIHLAAYHARFASTLLLDGDQNRSASGWAQRGHLPFKVGDERQAARYARDYVHTVIDTQARPAPEDLRVLVEGSISLSFRPRLMRSLSMPSCLRLEHQGTLDRQIVEFC